jgi:hypothetical protein
MPAQKLAGRADLVIVATARKARDFAQKILQPRHRLGQLSMTSLNPSSLGMQILTVIVSVQRQAFPFVLP